MILLIFLSILFLVTDTGLKEDNMIQVVQARKDIYTQYSGKWFRFRLSRVHLLE
ncbi:hypothetical protein I3760_16G069700 [Carya illinoinensis]|nr:hypothetical protein I3760_16G069700 [Carya illinoinensis]